MAQVPLNATERKNGAPKLLIGCAPGEIASGPAAPWPRSRSARPAGDQIAYGDLSNSPCCLSGVRTEAPDGLTRQTFSYKKSVARPERFELPTTWFEARCSIQLS